MGQQHIPKTAREACCRCGLGKRVFAARQRSWIVSSFIIRYTVLLITETDQICLADDVGTNIP